MAVTDEKLRMIGQMAREAGLLDDPQWLDRLKEPAPLWVVLDIMLRWIDRSDARNGPYD